MNKYQKSMEDIKLTDEAKERILNGVQKNFEKKTSIRKVVFKLAPVAAAAAVFVLVLTTPLGNVIFGKKTKGVDLVENTGVITTQAATQYEGESNNAVNGGPDQKTVKNGTDAISKSDKENQIGGSQNTSDDLIVDYKGGKVSTTECTACRYELKGKTVEELMNSLFGEKKSDLIKIDIPEATEAGVTLFGQDGKVLYAAVPVDKYAVVCSFLYPTDPVSAWKMAVNLAAFPFD